MLVGGDDSLALVERGAATWLRQEALGSVTGSLFLDLPAPSPELAAQWRAAAPTLSERIRAEFLSIKARPEPCHLPREAGRCSLPAYCTGAAHEFPSAMGWSWVVELASQVGQHAMMCGLSSCETSDLGQPCCSSKSRSKSHTLQSGLHRCCSLA